MMHFNASIDKNGYTPYYIQVMNIIKEQIEHGDVKVGDQLPGEPELCRIFNVSRTVIRQALKELEHSGQIIREKGRGTFVAESKIRESLFQELTGFYQDMEAKGHPPVSDVLKQKEIAATPKIANYLEIEIGQPVIHIDRLRYVNDEPIVLVETYLPADLCPGLLELDLANRSLYAYLEKEHGIQITSGRRIIEASIADEIQAELLKIKKGAPLIIFDSVSYGPNGEPIEYYHAVHRGDRSRFEVELIRKREPA